MEKSIKEYIEETNEIFDKASPAEKRVMIAKDTIRRIEAQNIIPKAGVLIENWINASDFNQFKDYINDESTPKCNVCAKGALFCSIIGRVNKFSIDELVSYGHTNDCDDVIHTKLNNFFTLEQLDLIETAIEKRSYLEVAYEDDILKAEQFRENGEEDETVLVRICQNIIENKGEFKP